MKNGQSSQFNDSEHLRHLQCLRPFILHDTNLVLSGSHHQDSLLKNALYMSKIDYSLFKYDIFPLFLSNRDNILHITECVI